ncbi:HD-GYP domain-containing protein [Vibrio quintilis]|uniref:HD-GYP domain-containing protein n=1 Tax=Vibrio quintilis TaxID=1117707 RepID=UPI00093768B1|nr:HD-GYP domain-containing protein [Vibrio quintilis]
MDSIKINSDRLQPGLYIRLPVKWNDHPFLLNSFKLKNQEQIEIIKHLGISFVYLYPDKSDKQPLPPPTLQEDSPDTKSEAKPEKNQLSDEAQKLWDEKQQRIEKLNAYRRRVSRCEKEFNRSLAHLRAIMNKIRNRPEDAAGEATKLVDHITSTLLNEEDVTLHLINDKSKETEDIYFHSLNVAVLSIIVGKAKGYDVAKIKLLAMASLFHDIGKIKVPRTILKKQTPLTEPEQNYLKQHTRYGVEIAETIEGFPEEAVIIIAQHHEMLDGSGYPEGLKGDEIDELAQIVALTNAFDSRCHSNITGDQKIPYAALSYLYKQKHLYNNENLNLLIKYMGVYPPGSLVELSNGMIGLVISVNSNQLLHPSVLVYDASVPRNQAPIIDLSDREELSVVSVVTPGKIPEKVLEYLSPRAKVSYYIDSGS